MSRRYLAPLLGDIDERDWMLYAECRSISPYLFFPDPDISLSMKRRMVHEAKTICKQCAVRPDCLDWALRHDENGVWGGTTESERRKIQKRRAS